MSTLLVATLILPLIISVILFLSWKKNENENPKMSKLALVFAIIFLAVAIGLGILWYLLSVPSVVM